MDKVISKAKVVLTLLSFDFSHSHILIPIVQPSTSSFLTLPAGPTDHSFYIISAVYSHILGILTVSLCPMVSGYGAM